MNQLWTLLLIIIVVIVIIIVLGALFSRKCNNVIPSSVYSEMNVLWQDNVSISREYTILAVGSNPNANRSLNRLRSNQVALGNNLARIYGSEAGNAYGALLDEGVDLEVAAINDIRAGRDPNPNISLWMVNAGKTSKALNIASRGCINENVMNTNFNNYIDATIAQARAINSGNYVEADIALAQGQASAADISTTIQKCARL